MPAIDVLDGKTVRLKQGDFACVRTYADDPVALAEKYAEQGAKRLHIVDLAGAKSGKHESKFRDLIRTIASRTRVVIQAGGGIRTLQDIQTLLDAGAERVVIGTLLLQKPETVRRALLLFGKKRITAALDTRDGSVCIKGWQNRTNIPLQNALQSIAAMGMEDVLITDIERDGMGTGPGIELYTESRRQFPELHITASGGIRNTRDIRALRDAGCDGAVVGTALLTKQTRLQELISAAESALAVRVIHCLDIAGGRVVKGTAFQNLRDAGDPVELARRYGDEGADELVFLDISATREERKTVFALAEKVADAINIPFTVGGGVRSVADAKRLLEAGADKVAVNSAAVLHPELLSAMAKQLGRANTVCAIDARRTTDGWTVLIKGGTEETGKDAPAWAREAVKRGAGELLITSFDRDGTGKGFDLELLAQIKERVAAPVIASGGAGTLQSFVDAVEQGRADAVLAASVFHFGKLAIRDVKTALLHASFPARL